MESNSYLLLILLLPAALLLSLAQLLLRQDLVMMDLNAVLELGRTVVVLRRLGQAHASQRVGEAGNVCSLLGLTAVLVLLLRGQAAFLKGVAQLVSLRISRRLGQNRLREVVVSGVFVCLVVVVRVGASVLLRLPVSVCGRGCILGSGGGGSSSGGGGGG